MVMRGQGQKLGDLSDGDRLSRGDIVPKTIGAQDQAMINLNCMQSSVRSPSAASSKKSQKVSGVS